MKSIREIWLGMLALIMGLTSCGGPKTKTASDNEDILVTVGDSTLRVLDVVKKIPAGLSAEDSTEMFNRITEKWVERLVLENVAEKNVTDMAKIDEMVRSYRNNLIVSQYLSVMEQRGNEEISEKRIRQYYDAHKSEMVLAEPIIKGIFIKTASDSEDLSKLRRWVASGTENAVDNIEKYGLRLASGYEYFRDSWTAWHSVAELIPYRFYDADAFVKSTQNFETEYAESVYMLRIDSVKYSGEEMPYDYARTEIRNILLNEDAVASRQRLINRIYTDAVSEGTLKAGKYDPISKQYRKEKDKK